MAGAEETPAVAVLRCAVGDDGSMSRVRRAESSPPGAAALRNSDRAADRVVGGGAEDDLEPGLDRRELLPPEVLLQHAFDRRLELLVDRGVPELVLLTVVELVAVLLEEGDLAGHRCQQDFKSRAK